MSAEAQANQSQTPEVKQNDKEFNFRALQAKHEKELQQERAARAEAERIAKEALERARSVDSDDDEDSEPYVDNRRLEKKLSKFGQSTQSEIQKAMEIAKERAKEELKQEMWLENNPDFYDVLQHADKIATRAPDLAKTILSMPEGFERQKLVYHNIKYLKLDQPEQKESTIQDKLDSRKRGAFYQPTGVGSSPYAPQGDFSAVGIKNAYDKMQQLKQNLRLG